MNRVMRIARTEGNRIYNKSAVDYANVARDAGCDIVKQWVAVLDGRTRESHQELFWLTNIMDTIKTIRQTLI